MFKQPTVVVIGAGAGVEYDMPLGCALAGRIAQDLRFRFDRWKSSDPISGDPELYRLLRIRFQDERDNVGRFVNLGRQLAAVLTSSISIDDALFQLSETPEAVTLGKVCIVRSILSAEANSTLKLSDRHAGPEASAGLNGWIEQLFSMSISGFRQSELEHAFDKLTFVSFNYDRCLEHYLYWALRRIGLDEPRAATIIANLNIIRPYGGVGSILQSSPDYVPYGREIDPFNAISRIRTYTESETIHDGSKLEYALETAKLVMFLGFGFHAQNMDLLRASSSKYRQVMGTVKNVHPGNTPAIAAEIASKLRCEDSDRVELFNMTTPEMLRDLRPKILLTVG